MKVKKALALLLALVLTVGLLPGRALAAESDEFTTVNTEQELMEALKEGTEKIKLGKDISSKDNFDLRKKVIVDLDGHTWTGTQGGTDFLSIRGGSDVTLQNGTGSFSITISGGKLTLSGIKLAGMVNCNGGELVSMEDCTITGGNGSNYPQGVYVRENGSVGTIKNCTIDLTGNVQPMPLVVQGGSIDTIEGCTISATNKGSEKFFYAVNIYGGSVKTIKDCTITANGKNSCIGIDIGESASVESIEGSTITVKNTATDDDSKFDTGLSNSGKIGTIKECTITARSSISSYGEIDEISGCVLNAEYDCITSGKGTIGSILSNTMTATGTYGKGMEVLGSVGTVAYNNVVQAPGSFIIVHESGKIETVNGNAGDSGIYIDGEIGTISGNALAGFRNNGTIGLLGRNVFPEGAANEGTIKKTDDSSPLDDLDEGKWYYKAMAYAYEENLTFGIPDGKFNPDDKLTRAMLAQMLWNLEERPASDGGAFADVASGAWYRNSVNWAAGEEIVVGHDGKFVPDNNITREQVATILYRYVKNSGGDVSQKADLSGYTDSSRISAYALEAMQWANAVGLMKGTTDTALSPQGNTTCAEMATILMRLAEK